MTRSEITNCAAILAAGIMANQAGSIRYDEHSAVELMEKITEEITEQIEKKYEVQYPMF